MNKEEESALVASCLRGERAGWQRFVESFTRLVYATIVRLAGARGIQLQEAEIADLHNSIFAGFWERDGAKLRRFGGRSRLSTWVRTVSANASIDYFRRRIRAERLFSAHPFDEGFVAGEGRDSVSRLEWLEEMDLLESVVAELSASERRLVEVVFLREATTQEACVELGCSAGALYTRKNRVLNKLRRQLRRKKARKNSS